MRILIACEFSGTMGLTMPISKALNEVIKKIVRLLNRLGFNVDYNDGSDWT